MRFLTLILSLFWLANASAQQTLSDLGSWYLNLNIQISNLRANHQESSVTSGFVAPSYKNTYKKSTFLFQLEKEFFSHWPVSMSFFPVLGVGFLISDQERKASVSYDESLLGLQYGAGVSLNFNIIGDSLKIQPFISMASMNVTDTFFFRYDDRSDEQRSREIETVQTYTLLQSTAGIRFFNTKNLISTLAISIYQYDNFKTETEASLGETDYTLDQTAEYHRDNASIQLGFGIIF